MTALIGLDGSGHFCRVLRLCIALLVLFACSFAIFSQFEVEAAGINDTKHNLSVSGPGAIKSLTENRICVFCHTPHNSYRLSGTAGGSGPTAPEEFTYLPLWNHEVTRTPETQLYTSPTLQTLLSQPTGPTKLCLSCHDGTVAIGAVASGANLGIAGKMSEPPANPNSNIGLDLSSHHPVSFPYSSSLPNPELSSIESLPSSIRFWGNGEVHCSTCHDPHDDTFGNFLAMDNSSSQLCKACHLLTGWNVDAHNQCDYCHTPHFAVQSEWLLTFSSEDACLACHGGPGPIVHITAAASQFRSAKTSPLVSQPVDRPALNIKRQMEKISSHRPTGNALIVSQKTYLAQRRSVKSDVTCMGCHNPHSINGKKASAPYASGMLEGVSGIDRNGMEVSSSAYEYEVCFKCHSDYSLDSPYVPRVINSTNKRLQFDPINPSYHPVVRMGKNFNVPSIPSSYEPSLTVSSIIYCTDCHRDDSGGSKGPHGSTVSPILRERYETTDSTPESNQSYALCYRCHNRSSILSDASFKKKTNRKTVTGGGHSGHLAKGAPCSACHDPHGIADNGSSGSHTHLVNFDTRIVMASGGKYPFFTDAGTFSGSCTLICHGRVHTNESYP